MKAHIEKSKLHGKGIYTQRNIVKGETIFIVKGEKVKFLISDEKRAKIAGLNWVGYRKNTWIDPKLFSVFLNHSCEPNAFITDKMKIVARYNIKNKEEVTIDYSLNEGDIFWHMKCSCGAKNCRKTIKSIQFLPKMFFVKNKRYVPKYYQQIFKDFCAANFKSPQDLRVAWVSFLTKGFKV